MRKVTQPRTARRTLAMTLALGLTAATVAMGIGSATTASAASTGSEVTVKGKGAFSSLAVTVDQTDDLVNQVINVSWTGGAPTEPNAGSFYLNYLQVMQCWGDSSSGPTPDQCQYGGLAGYDTRGGNYVASRQVNADVIDPAQTVSAGAGNKFVPFHSVTGSTEPGPGSQLFDSNSTNEQPFGRTRSDGSGLLPFEIQTAREAPGLGCGTLIGNTGKGRSCWLVVVPRNDREVDGSLRQANSTDQLQSSPLSATNWANRLLVKLQFEPIGKVCPIGAKERRTVGQEIVSDAVYSWQPVLCRNGGAIYGYSKIADSTSRAKLQSTDPGLVFISKPLPAENAPSSGPVTYAPVAVSGLTLGFAIDSRSLPGASDSLRERDGERLKDLKLSPRLVAKLLTQTYRFAVDYQATDVENNPLDMTRDPDFLKLNPSFTDLYFPNISSALVPVGATDLTEELWNWLNSDAEAKAFLSGKPDPWGTTINPNYKSMDFPINNFPKLDPFCKVLGNGVPDLCQLDQHPFADDFNGAGAAASRGDGLSRTTWDPLAIPPSFKKDSRQPSGQISLIAVTDASAAHRYGLIPAKLKNAVGEYVAPTNASMVAAIPGMTLDKASGMRLPNPAAKIRGAYPLTSITYAATVKGALDAGARKDYAAFLKYAAGPGQVQGVTIGTLPPGYAPMPISLKNQTLTAAAALTATGATTSSDDETGSDPSSSGGSGGSGGSPSAMNDPEAPGADQVAVAQVNSDDQKAVAAISTPATSVGAVRFVFLAVLLVAILAAIAGPALSQFGKLQRN